MSVDIKWHLLLLCISGHSLCDFHANHFGDPHQSGLLLLTAEGPFSIDSNSHEWYLSEILIFKLSPANRPQNNSFLVMGRCLQWLICVQLPPTLPLIPVINRRMHWAFIFLTSIASRTSVAGQSDGQKAEKNSQKRKFAFITQPAVVPLEEQQFRRVCWKIFRSWRNEKRCLERRAARKTRRSQLY